MSGNTTHTTQALIREQAYSQLILDELQMGFLPEGITRDVSDFPDGTVLNIPTFGEVVIKDVIEDQDTPIDTIDTGRIRMEITEHTGGGAYITDELREDAYYIEQFDAAFPGKAMHSLKEVYETDMLATGEQDEGQFKGQPNDINKFAHRYVASGAGQEITLLDFAYARTAMLKAKTPDSGMIAIVDPIVELTINGLTNINNVSNNPHFEGIVETGFSKNLKFLKNIYGVDVYMSDRLPRIDSETIDATANGVVAPRGQTGPTTVNNGVACLFMNVTDDMTTPFMSAWRRYPKVEYNRDVPKRRDEYYVTSRYGFGMQRPQSLVTVLASCENY